MQCSSEAEQGFVSLTAGAKTAGRCGQQHDTASPSFEAAPGQRVWSLELFRQRDVPAVLWPSSVRKAQLSKHLPSAWLSYTSSGPGSSLHPLDGIDFCSMRDSPASLLSQVGASAGFNTESSQKTEDSTVTY